MIKDKDMKFIGKQFKRSEKSLLDIHNVYLGFMKGDGKGLLHSSVESYLSYDEDMRDLIIKNLKKVFSGKLDEKIFASSFVDSAYDNENSAYSILSGIENCDEYKFKNTCDKLSNCIVDNNVYDENVVLLAAQCSVHMDGVRRTLFVSTVCPVKLGEANFIFKGKTDKSDASFELTSSMDSIINIKAPMDGICYPILTNGTVLKESILYYSKKKNKPNTVFMSNVLGCNIELTAEQENIFFNSILTEVSGGKLSGKELYTIYTHLRNNISEDEIEEDIEIDRFEIKKALEKSNIPLKVEIEDAFKKIFGFDNYIFKAPNVLPPVEKKSITITNDDASIQVKPDILKDMRQVQDENGQVFLMIPMTETAATNGVTLETERL